MRVQQALWLCCCLLSSSPVNGFVVSTPAAQQQAPRRQQQQQQILSLSPQDNDGGDSSSPFFFMTEKQEPPEEVDVAIIGAGLGGLCAGAILNTLYNKKVAIYESHYLAGGCAHAFTRKSRTSGQEFVLDSGPTILLGCSQPPWNALQQVLQAVGRDGDVQWIPYNGWGMVERPQQQTTDQQETRRWKVTLGPNHFEQGPLTTFGGPKAVQEYKQLCNLTQPLLAGVEIPAMAMRSGVSALIPLALRHFDTLSRLLSLGPDATATGTFAPYMDGPIFTVTDPWLRNWLDALAFSLSGLPASRTAAAAMAFTVADMHKTGAALDYPKGGMGTIVDALVRGVQQGPHQSKVQLRRHVERIDFTMTSVGSVAATGLTLRNGQRVVARDGVICNAPVWSLRGLVEHDSLALQKLQGFGPIVADDRRSSWIVSENNDDKNDATTTTASTIRLQRPPEWDKSDTTKRKNGATAAEPPPPPPPSLLEQCDLAEQTGSFLHLHLALNATGLDLTQMEAHYTVMDRGLSGNADNTVSDGPCGELNMIAVSNPCVLDPTLAPPGTMVVHAYGAGNEPYDIWKDLDRRSPEYERLKEERCQVLWRAVESVIPDVRNRVLLDLTGSPLTHERFLRRPQGTYGSATEDYLKDGATPIDKLVLAGDGIFPGIGVPAVALSGASAANSLVNPWQHWQCLERLQKKQEEKGQNPAATATYQ